jgi:putative DNA primase/helicase
MSAANPILEAALAYAARGWPVFPCHPETKAPLVPKGLKEASADADLVRAWWGRWPAAMIGLPLGGPTGLFALDFDPRAETDPETGEVRAWTYADLKAETEALLGHALPATAAQKTPSGGFHIFYLQPEGEPLGNRTGRLPAHVDVRGQGGYVIAAPSVRSDGRAYAWVAQRDPDACPPAPAPEALVALIRAGKVRDSAPAAGVKDSLTTASEAVRKYALAALDAEARALAGTPMGGRNNQINASAFALGQLVGAGAISQSTARACLLDVVRAWPDVAKSEKTIENGLAAGMAVPRDISDIEAKAAERAARAERRGGGARVRGEEPPSPMGEDSLSFQMEGSGEPPQNRGRGRDGRAGNSRPTGKRLDETAAFLPQTDLGNAERWVLRYGDAFRWVPEWGWLAWDGRRWNKPEAETMLQQSIFATVRAIQDEGRAIEESGLHPDDGGNADGLNRVTKRDKNGEPIQWLADKLASWGRASESSARIKSVETLVKPKVSAHPGDFDCDPMVLNVLNGTLVFERGGADFGDPIVTLRPHCPDDLITKLAPVEYRPGAPRPLFDAFLAEVQPDAQIRRFLAAWGGYNLTGDTAEQVFVINHGLGANGKSVWADVLGWLMGDYSTTVGIETFLDQGNGRRGSDATPDLAELPGRRFVRTSEPRRGRSFAEELIKLITGQEPMKVRHLNRDFFEFTPVMKITVSANQRPEASSDAAFWRRVVLVPWEVIIPPDRRDKNLAVKLRDEAPGILNWLLDGACDWMAGGLPLADRIREATDSYREDRDPLGRFLAMATEPEPEGRVQSSHLYEVYQAWAKFASEAEWTQKGFSGAMADRGFRKKTSNGVWWLGLKLTRQVGDFIDFATGRPRTDLPETPPPDKMEGWAEG